MAPFPCTAHRQGPLRTIQPVFHYTVRGASAAGGTEPANQSIVDATPLAAIEKESAMKKSAPAALLMILSSSSAVLASGGVDGDGAGIMAYLFLKRYRCVLLLSSLYSEDCTNIGRCYLENYKMSKS